MSLMMRQLTRTPVGNQINTSRSLRAWAMCVQGQCARAMYNYVYCTIQTYKIETNVTDLVQSPYVVEFSAPWTKESNDTHTSQPFLEWICSQVNKKLYYIHEYVNYNKYFLKTAQFMGCQCVCECKKYGTSSYVHDCTQYTITPYTIHHTCKSNYRYGGNYIERCVKCTWYTYGLQ